MEIILINWRVIRAVYNSIFYEGIKDSVFFPPLRRGHDSNVSLDFYSIVIFGAFPSEKLPELAKAAHPLTLDHINNTYSHPRLCPNCQG